jgi:hypothetical protein
MFWNILKRRETKVNKNKGKIVLFFFALRMGLKTVRCTRRTPENAEPQ